LTCRGFLPGETVSLFWDDIGTKPLVTVAAGGSGNVTLSGKAPVSTSGRHSAIARGETSRKRVSSAVTVQPRIAISPDEGTSGAKVTVELTGFKAGETVSLRFYTTSSRYKTVRQSATVSASGGVRFTFVVPDGVTAGGHKVEARGSGGSRASTTFDVTVGQLAGESENVQQASVEESRQLGEQTYRHKPAATPVPDPEPSATPTELPVETEELVSASA